MGAPSRAGYPGRMELELFFVILLVISSLGIGWFSVYVLYRLYAGQR